MKTELLDYNPDIDPIEDDQESADDQHEIEADSILHEPDPEDDDLDPTETYETEDEDIDDAE